MRITSKNAISGLAALVAAGALAGCVDLSQPFSFNLDPAAVKNNGPYNVNIADGGNGTLAVSVNPHATTTTPPATTIPLSWVAPTTRVNGTALALSEIGGYTIKYGTASGSYTGTVKVTGGSTTTYTLSNLSPATYYVVVSAFDTQGNNGPNSTELSKILK